MTEALSNELDDQFSLPPHHKCASHTLNLISTTDVEKQLLAIPDTKATYKSGIAKCTALWNKASHSTVASELAEDVSPRKLVVPTSTRWNYFYEAVFRITEISISDLNGLCIKLGIKGFTDKEYQFLKEYCVVMKPLTLALDILQGEEHCFYGTLLPTLEILMSKMLSMKASLSKVTAGLPDVILQVGQTMQCRLIIMSFYVLQLNYCLNYFEITIKNLNVKKNRTHKENTMKNVQLTQLIQFINKHYIMHSADTIISKAFTLHKGRFVIPRQMDFESNFHKIKKINKNPQLLYVQNKQCLQLLSFG